MCFRVNADEAKPLVAETDMFCYKTGYKKMLGYKFVSTYKGFTYVKSKTVSAYKPTALAQIKLDKPGRCFRNNIEFDAIAWIDVGFHSYITAEQAGKNAEFDGECVARFIIPKGSTYYINTYDGQYVSDSIRFEKFLREDK